MLSFQTPPGKDKEEDVQEVIRSLAEKGFQGTCLSSNEMAKVHARHLAGGRAPEVTNERLISFTFPEQPGALKRFLDELSGKFNVSLFHYRNHGDDLGRVLVGLQVEPEQSEALQLFVDELGYDYIFEDDNPVYHQFLL
uniref:ACT-like domain-containing protein n=1 Tax=Fibrocapsa japonica TaxID=94617 RepID=A0A7S2V5T1_9STRA|mmetsp:Transcript_5698/g.8626  ORF Transcript_5698/g.8626 Transcript_5698/m.8626 type:complete len:139 (+) Transcript_5698:1-417(+)